MRRNDGGDLNLGTRPPPPNDNAGSFLNTRRVSPKTGPHLALPPFRGPYAGDYNGSMWNAQGYWAADPDQQHHKRRHATKIMETRDFLGLNETHGSEGKIVGADMGQGSRSFWSHGTHHEAGVGLLISDDFLRKFNPGVDEDWTEIIPGRIARLRLNGPLGSLDIYTAYLKAGSNQDARQERQVAARLLAHSMAPQKDRLSLVLGDFNYVTASEDRYTKGSLNYSGGPDAKETEYFEKTVWKPFGLHEIQQPLVTHSSASADSRLDRIYSNHYVCDQLDRHYSCYTLPMNKNLSDHSPLCFGRRTSQYNEHRQECITESSIRHPDFARRVHIELTHLIVKDTLEDTPFRRLILTKRAMWTVHLGLQDSCKELDEKGDPRGHTSQVGWIMAFIRAAEKVNLGRMRTCALACPTICSYVNPADPEARSKDGMHQLRNFAVQLSRKEIAEEVLEIQEEDAADENPLGEEEKDEREFKRNKKKQTIVAKLKRLLPGQPNTLGAIRQEDGTVTNEPEKMAEALCKHWRKVFSKKSINQELLVKWFEFLRDSRAAETSLPVDHKLPDKGDAMGSTRLPRRALPRDPAAWTPRRKDMVKALRLSGNSSPGPDGIPFSAWRQLGELGVYTLHEVATALRAEDSVTQLRAAYKDECEHNGHDYNLSTLAGR